MIKRLLLIGLVISAPLIGEIQTFTFSWRKENCDEKCERMLERMLRRIPQVAEVKMFPGSGTATLFWKPTVAFKFDSPRLVMHRIGLKLDDHNAYLKARGVVVSKGQRYYLISLGDNTRIELLSPAPRSEKEYVVEGNISTYKVREPLLSQLKDAEKKDALVTIEGPLFQPFRPDLRVIVNSANVQRFN